MRGSGGVSYLSLAEAVQDIFVRQLSGRLSVSLERESHSLLFLSGQLYLSAANPFGQRMKSLLAGPHDERDDPRFDAVRRFHMELAEIVGELTRLLAGADSQEPRFENTIETVPEELYGPVPTGVLVMNLFEREETDANALRRLGGLGARFQASEEIMLRRRVPELDDGEARLLERLEQVADLRTLIAESGGEVTGMLRSLTRLEAVRLVVSVDSDAHVRLPAGFVDDISRRVAKSLAENPVDLSDTAHRARLAKLLQRYGELDYYELLGADVEMTADEIHGRFMELARLAHPGHAERLGMRDSVRLEWLFTRLTDAYFVLSDPERAANYRRDLGRSPERRPTPPRERARRSERVRLARQQYHRARECVDREDFHYAVELLRQAAQLDPRAEYFILLARSQRRNPRWLHMAIDSYRQAAALRPEDGALREELEQTVRDFRQLQGRGDAEERVEELSTRGATGIGRKLFDLISRRRGSSKGPLGGRSG